MKKILFKRGFTLIELLVVIAIIGILTAIVTANFSTAKSKSRDAKRISDIAQLQLVLEQAFDKCNAYPPNINDKTTVILAGCTDSSGNNLTLEYFISNIPKDPTTGTVYEYKTNDVAPYTDYVLKASLENFNQAILSDDIDGSIYGVNCADDANQTPVQAYYCVQPK